MLKEDCSVDGVAKVRTC